MGDITLGLAGKVQGSTLKLTSVSPFEVKALPKAKVTVEPLPFPACCTNTNKLGKYQVSGVPVGDYIVDTFFSGIITEPDGDESFARFAAAQRGNIDFDGAVQIKDFRFTSTGALQLTVRDVSGGPVRDARVSLSARGGQLGQGYEAPRASCFGSTDAAGQVTLSSENFSCFSNEADISGVPQGPCEITVLDASGNPLTTLGPEDGCFLNQAGELLELEVEAEALP